MPTRRQEKMARAVKEIVSEVILKHLSDPRIVGFVSVTRVKVAADLRIADVYLSIFGSDAAGEKKTYQAIEHARPKIQSMLADEIESRFCPVLRFHKDEEFKKALETLRLLEEISAENRKKEEQQENS